MRVLFIGNSHTYFNDMPELFARMVREMTGEKPEVTMLAYSGRSLAWHREEYFSIRFALLYGGFDFCVLQQQAHPFPGEEATFRSAHEILELCRKCNVQPVIYMTWAKKDEPEMTEVMSRAYRKLAGEENVLLAPVGELFAEVQQKHPESDLFWNDGAHASVYGDYLIAATFAGLLAGTERLEELTDKAFAFNVDFDGAEGRPLAVEDAKELCVELDETKTKAIRNIVKRALG